VKNEGIQNFNSVGHVRRLEVLSSIRAQNWKLLIPWVAMLPWVWNSIRITLEIIKICNLRVNY